jgi:hypothetical protein
VAPQELRQPVPVALAIPAAVAGNDHAAAGEDSGAAARGAPIRVAAHGSCARSARRSGIDLGSNQRSAWTSTSSSGQSLSCSSRERLN